MKVPPKYWIYTKEFREEYLELSQSELAKELEVSTSTVSKWDQGIRNPNDENLLQIQEIMEK